jgi:Xaa-Pro aminopeptidase
MEDHFPDIEICDIYPLFSELRRIKSPYEVSLIRKAIEATHEAILQVYKMAKPGMPEYALAAEFAFTLAKMGLGEPSFPSIVATGRNFNYLHYPQLDTVIEKGELVLMDLGACYGGLCSDISRAFPIDGTFTEKQRAIYQIVRACQDLAFEQIKPGAYLKDINNACKELSGKRLSLLGITVRPDGEDEYYWHNVSHHLGLDVHDICSRDVILEEGMVLTVEPGVYVPEWNVGLRIEDNVLVTKTGCEILSDFIPREADEIEALLSR